ncbi:MAG: hypothetical protein ACPGSH_00165 [Ilumatobacteraceae bacterium]
MADEPALVQLGLDRGVATITLDSQPNRNALSRRLLDDLHRALDGAEEAEARELEQAGTEPEAPDTEAPSDTEIVSEGQES